VGATHVLITRPEPECQALAQRLEAEGLVPIVLPPYRFEALTIEGQDGLNWSGQGRRLAIFTSTRAVQFGLAQLQHGFLQGVEVAAIGPATAEALRAAGLAVSMVPSGRYTSEALLEHPDLERTPGSARIFTAPGGREALQQGLEQRGWEVRMVHVYRRVEQIPSDHAAALLGRVRSLVSVWTSENAMQQLAGQLPQSAWRAVCRGLAVTTSERLAASLRHLGVSEVRLAQGPGNDEIAACVLDLISTS